MFALLMPVLFGAAAFGVDLGSLLLDMRRLKSATDLAVVAAVTDPAEAEARVRRILAANGFPNASFRLAWGSHTADPARTPDQRFTAGTGENGAAQLTVAAVSPVMFGKLLHVPDFSLNATSVAAVSPTASFALTSGLAALDGGALNAVLAETLGAGVSLGVLDGRRLAGASLDAGRLAALLTPGAEPDARVPAFLAASLDVRTLFAAAGRATREKGESGAAAVFERLSRQVPAGRARLTGAELIAIGPGLPKASYPSAALDVDVNALDLLLASVAATAAHRPAMTLEHDFGIASVSVEVRLGEDGHQSPLLAVGAVGTRLDSAQLRARLVARVGAGKGVLALASLELPLQVLAGSGTAQLQSISCAGPASARRATLTITPGLLDAALGTFDAPLARARVGDRPRPAAVVRGLGLAEVKASAQLPLGSGRPTTLSFEAADIAAGRTKSVAGTRFAGSIAAALIERADIDVTLLGQNLALRLPGTSGSEIERATGDQIATLAAPLDAMLDGLTALVGARLGTAEVRVTGLKCAAARLVL